MSKAMCLCIRIRAQSGQDRGAFVPSPSCLPCLPAITWTGLAPSKRPCVPRGLLPLPPQSSAEGGEVHVASHPSSHEQGAAVWAPGWGGSMLFLRARVRRQKELVSCHAGASHRWSGEALIGLLDGHPLAGPGLSGYLLDAWGDTPGNCVNGGPTEPLSEPHCSPAPGNT